MFHTLGFLLIVVIATITIGLVPIGSMLGTIFGLRKRSSASGSRSQNSAHDNSRQKYYRPTQASDKEEIITETGANKRKKLFDGNEEEYADYEEIKDW